MNKKVYIAYYLYKKVALLNNKKEKGVFKTWSRSSTIIPMMIGHIILIYNGKRHIPLKVSSSLIGHKLGEFVSTRFFQTHRETEEMIKEKMVKKNKKK
jgi:small subunit ribosomal protein S19